MHTSHTISKLHCGDLLQVIVQVKRHAKNATFRQPGHTLASLRERLINRRRQRIADGKRLRHRVDVGRVKAVDSNGACCCCRCGSTPRCMVELVPAVLHTFWIYTVAKLVDQPR